MEKFRICDIIIKNYEGNKNMLSRIKNILEEYVAGLNEIIGADLKQVILYGSYAREEQKQDEEISDIDIMILVDADADEIKKLEKRVLDYSYDLDLKYDILLSPMIENVDDYNSRINYITFYKNVKEEGVLISE